MIKLTLKEKLFVELNLSNPLVSISRKAEWIFIVLSSRFVIKPI